MSVGIVIPVWNLWDTMTLPCLMSLVKYTNIQDIHVYLVDNASTDKTASHAEKMGCSLFGKDHFTYIKNQENLGFAVACNQGAEATKKDGHEFILFLNNDTIVTENWLPPLVKAMENPRIGMVGPLLLYPDSTVQHCGVVFNPIGKVAHIYSYFPQNHPVVKKSRKYRVITGAVLLCRTQEFFALGGFYEGFKNGFEDIDLCYAYVENEQMQKVITNSVVYHHTSQTPGRLDSEVNLRNGQLLAERKQNIIRDAHLYYAQDGYVPALTKDFVGYVRLSEEKRKSFNKQIKENYSDTLCRSLLNQEPFWHDGYQILIESLVKQNLILDALQVCQKAISYKYCRQTLEQFIKVAEKTHDEKLYLDIKIPTEQQIAKFTPNKLGYQQRFMDYFSGNDWCEKLLETQKLDNEIFGDY